MVVVDFALVVVVDFGAVVVEVVSVLAVSGGGRRRGGGIDDVHREGHGLVVGLGDAGRE